MARHGHGLRARPSRATSPRTAARRRCERLLAEHPDLDGVFVANDLMAQGALLALRDRGRRVPDDVAVVGFDDSSAALAGRPPLTTVRHPLEDMAAEMRPAAAGPHRGAATAGHLGHLRARPWWCASPPDRRTPAMVTESLVASLVRAQHPSLRRTAATGRQRLGQHRCSGWARLVGAPAAARGGGAAPGQRAALVAHLAPCSRCPCRSRSRWACRRGSTRGRGA